MKKLGLLLVLLVSIYANYKIIPHKSVVTGEHIGFTSFFEVSDGNVAITRCFDFTRISRPDDSYYDIEFSHDIISKFVPVQDSIFAFTFISEDTSSSTCNIQAQRVYPNLGTPRLLQVSMAVSEWFPFASRGTLKLLVTVESNLGHEDSSFFRENRDAYFLNFPELEIEHSIENIAKPLDVIETSYALAIICERKIIEIDTLAESVRESNLTETTVLHLDKASYDSLGFQDVGKKGIVSEFFESGEYEGIYHGVTIGMSDKDINGDSLLDFPSMNSIVREGITASENYSINIESTTVFSSETPISYDVLFLSDFLPGSGNDLILGNSYYSGTGYDETDVFDSWFDELSAIKGFFDVSGDGFSELYGWWGDTVMTYKIHPNEISWEFKTGWNVVSLPYTNMDSIVTNYPFLIPPAFSFNPHTHNYEAAYTLTAGYGYYALSDRDTVLYPSGDSLTSYEVVYGRGWNMLGCLSQWMPTNFIEDLDIVYVGPYVFEAESRAYLRPEALMPGTGFLFLASDSGSVTIEIPGGAR